MSRRLVRPEDTESRVIVPFLTATFVSPALNMWGTRPGVFGIDGSRVPPALEKCGVTEAEWLSFANRLKEGFKAYHHKMILYNCIPFGALIMLSTMKQFQREFVESISNALASLNCSVLAPKGMYAKVQTSTDRCNDCLTCHDIVPLLLKSWISIALNKVRCPSFPSD